MDTQKSWIETGDWEVLTLHDGADLFGTLTRTELTLRLGNEVDAPVAFGELKMLFNAAYMCHLIEEAEGLCLNHYDWNRLIDSAQMAPLTREHTDDRTSSENTELLSTGESGCQRSE